MKINVYEMVTNRIIETLEAGEIPWNKPWVWCERDIRTMAFNRVSKRPYSLLNQLMLGEAGEYASFKQWKQAGGHVKKGAKAQYVVFWKWLEVDNKDGEVDEDGNIIKEKIPFLQYDTVFHISQVEGVKPLTDKQLGIKEVEAKPFNAIEEAEVMMHSYIEREHIGLKFGGDRAFYSPSKDYIQLPEKTAFVSRNKFYSTAFHEMAHSTGHKSRLNRLNVANSFFGSEAYSREELVAEISSAALMNSLGIETKSTFTNSAAYIQNWLKALKNDKKMVVFASAQAEKAIARIIG